MAFRLGRPPLACTKSCFTIYTRCYATVRPVTFVGKPPQPPITSDVPAFTAPTALDSLILSQFRSISATNLPSLIQQYDEREGHILESSLPYESRPNSSRRVKFDHVDTQSENGVVMVAHAVRHQDRHKVALCSGFALNLPPSEDADATDRTVIVTCAHTLEEVNRPP